MKKLLSILLVVVLCASMMTLTAFAASGSMAASGAEMTPGSTATVTVSLTSNPGVMSYTVKPSVPEGFSISMAQAGMGGVWTFGKNAQWDNGGDSTYTGAILSVTVTADASVAPGTYYINFSASGSNYNEEDVSFGSCSAVITIPKPECAHSWDDGVVTTEPTCTDPGVKTYTCSACGETKTDSIDPKGHSFGDWNVTKEATCTEKGEEKRECACGETETRAIPEKGHSFGDWNVTKEATCTEKGEEKRECACGETETREIPLKEHEMNSYKKDSKGHWAKCDNCDYVSDKKESHSYDYNGVCECGAKKTTVVDPDLDDVPRTGDITPYIAMTFVSVLSLAAAAAYVLKRKTGK